MSTLAAIPIRVAIVPINLVFIAKIITLIAARSEPLAPIARGAFLIAPDALGVFTFGIFAFAPFALTPLTFGPCPLAAGAAIVCFPVRSLQSKGIAFSRTFTSTRGLFGYLDPGLGTRLRRRRRFDFRLGLRCRGWDGGWSRPGRLRAAVARTQLAAPVAFNFESRTGACLGGI